MSDLIDKDVGSGSSPPASVKHVVLLVHGIRTMGFWSHAAREVLERRHGVAAIPTGYPRFDAFRFWLPFFTRNGPVKKVLRQLRHAQRRYGNETPLSIIAHSFGTYVVLRILEDNDDIDLARLVLCGSVLPRSERWSNLRTRIGKCLNECGTHDSWPVLAEKTTWGYGASGTFGFAEPTDLVEDHFHRIGHSDFFDESREFFTSRWAPFVTEGVMPQRPRPIATADYPWYLRLLKLLPIKPIALAALVSLVVLVLMPHLGRLRADPYLALASVSLKSVDLQWRFSDAPASFEDLLALGEQTASAELSGSDEFRELPDEAAALVASMNIDNVMAPTVAAIALGSESLLAGFDADAVAEWQQGPEDPEFFSAPYDGPVFEILFPLDSTATVHLSLGNKADDSRDEEPPSGVSQGDGFWVYWWKWTNYDFETTIRADAGDLLLEWSYGPESLPEAVRGVGSSGPVYGFFPRVFDIEVVHGPADRTLGPGGEIVDATLECGAEPAEGSWSAKSKLTIVVNRLAELQYEYEVERIGVFARRVYVPYDGYETDYCHTVFRCSR